jgi:hypothetical protein
MEYLGSHIIGKKKWFFWKIVVHIVHTNAIHE